MVNIVGFPRITLPQCAEALGMRSGLISDAAIVASTIYHATYSRPQVGRLHYNSAGSGTYGSWLAASNNLGQWLQADLGNWTRITGVATQGRQDSNQWVKSYSLSTNNGIFFEFIKTDSGVKRVRNTGLLQVAPVNCYC